MKYRTRPDKSGTEDPLICLKSSLEIETKNSMEINSPCLWPSGTGCGHSVCFHCLVWTLNCAVCWNEHHCKFVKLSHFFQAFDLYLVYSAGNVYEWAVASDWTYVDIKLSKTDSSLHSSQYHYSDTIQTWGLVIIRFCHFTSCLLV